MEPPSFATSGPQVVRAAPGSDASFVLPLPSGSQPFHFEWSRAGVKLEDRFKPSSDSTGVRLTISSASTDDSGVYTLQASNAAGKDTTRVRLEVSPDENPTGEDPPTFLRRLQDLTVKVGTRTRFLVEIVSSTECRVTWYRNDRRLLEAERIALVRDGNFWCADISAVSVDDAGRWTCTAENVGGRASCSAHLNVLVPKAYKRPEFVEELRALLTEQGTVSLECKVVGVPTPVLRWFKDSREIKAGDVFALTANAEDPTSLGTYTCEAVNCMGRAYSSSKVHVIGRASREGSARPSSGGSALESSPIFTKQLEDQFVRICEPLKLSCNIVVPPWPRSVVWYNKEGKIEPNEKYRVLEDGLGGYLLEIQQAEWPDEGEWKCVATSSGGRVGITTCYVSMDVPKNYRRPRFMENLQAVLTEEGLVSFECKVVGFPTPVLSWFKDGQELKPGDVYQLTGTNSLGSYCCIARNCMGQRSSSAELTVEDIQNQLNEEEKLQLFSKNQAPKFLQGLKSVETKIDEPFRFIIKVAIPPDPTVSWYRDDQPVDESPRCHHGKEERDVFFLDIQSLEFMDQAEWKCVAMNDFGHSVTSCFLKLIIPRHYKKPRFLENLQAILSEEGAVNLECKVIGVPQPVLKWFKDGEELKPGDIHRIISGQDGTCCLGTYTCEAQNCMGIAASSASLLGFEDSIKEKCKKKSDEQTLQRNLSLSTIHEERTSQMYDTPVGDITLDDKGEISFSFDGREVSVSLYETPDLTEEEALQIVEMYADQLSENVTEHNVVELPPLRFVKETSTSGNLLMEAIIIDVSPEYFTSPEEDLRTEADVDDISIADENGSQQLSLDQEDVYDYLEKTVSVLSDEKADLPMIRERKRSDSQKSVDDYFSLSQDQSHSEEKKDDNTQFQSESDIQSFASARSSGKLKSKSSKPSVEEGLESSDVTKTVLLKEDFQNRQHDLDLILMKNKKVRRSSHSRRSSSSSERSLNIINEEVLEDKFERTLNITSGNENIDIDIINISSSLGKVINEVQMIERDIILQSELMSTAAMASQSLEIINSLIQSLSEIHSITDAITESVSEPLKVTISLFNRLPQSLNILHQSLKLIGKCTDLESDNQTIVKKTCIKIIDKCGEDLKELNSQIVTMMNKSCPFYEKMNVFDIKTSASEMLTTITYFLGAIKESKILTDEIDAKFYKISPEIKHLQNTQKAIYELKNPLKSLLNIVDEVNVSSLKGAENMMKSQIILNDMSIPIQDLQNALEQIESLSVTEAQPNLHNYNTEIIETVMESVLKLRTSFEQLSAESGQMGNEVELNDILIRIRHNINEISSHLDVFETKIGTFDILNCDNKLDALQKMAQILINLENNLLILDVIPTTKIHMVEFHKALTKILEYVIQSNEAHKYLKLLEICDTINRLNALLKNIDSHGLLLSLTGISNNLKIIQANLKKDVFTPDLNFTILSIISDVLLNIQETIHHAEISTCVMISENVENLSIQHLEKDKLNFVLEQIEAAVINIGNVVSAEVAKELALKQNLDKIFPSLEEIKSNIASLNVNVAEQEENISSTSDLSLIITVANPLCDLNHSISVLNQVIFEKVRDCSENNSLKTELVIPLVDLHNALEILQQDVISQYGENITYLNINSCIADAIQNVQSCILLVQGQDLLENIEEISTLEDISAIKTTADIMDADDFVSPIVEETSIKININNIQHTSVKLLDMLNNQLMNLSKLIDELDSSSEVYCCYNITRVKGELDKAHNIIEEILHPIQFQEHEVLQIFLKPSQFAMLIHPLQDLRESLSQIDKRNNSMEKQSHIDKIDIFLRNMSNCEINLNNSLNLIDVAIETVDNILEISTKVDTLQKLCKELYIFLNSSKEQAEDELLGLNVLEDAISHMLNTINYSKHLDISVLQKNIEHLNQCIITSQDEMIGFTVKTPVLLEIETKIFNLMYNIETTIVNLSQLHFVSKSPSCGIHGAKSIVDIDKIESITEITAVFIQNLPEHVLNDNLIFTKDLIDKFHNEVILFSYLIKQQPTPKRMIKILQVFYYLRENFRQIQTQKQDLYISEDLNKFISEAEACLKHIQTLLLDNFDLLSELIINIPISNIDNNEIVLNQILESNRFSNLHYIAKLFLNTIKSFKPSVETIHENIAKELEYSNIDLEIDCETVDAYNLFSSCLSTTISNKDIKDEQIFKIIFKIIESHGDCTNALGSGKKIIFMKCISDCLDVLKENCVAETKDKAFGKKSISKEYNIKDMLLELTEPIKNLNQKLTNICNLSEKRDHFSKEIQTLLDCHLQSIDETTKKIKHVKCENTYLDNFTISLVQDLNIKINLILKFLENLQDCCDLIFINEPIKELQSILLSILSEVIINEEPKQLNEKNDSFLQHLNSYIEIIETIEDDSTATKIDELKQSAEIVRELRRFSGPHIDVMENNSEKIELLINLQNNLISLREQAFDREQELSGLNENTREEIIKAITNLQDDLETLTDTCFILKSPKVVIDNLKNRVHHMQDDLSTQHGNDSSDLKIANLDSLDNVQIVVNALRELQYEELNEVSADVSQSNFVDILQVNGTISDIGNINVTKNENFAENHPRENDLELQFSQLKCDTNEIETDKISVGDEVEEKKSAGIESNMTSTIVEATTREIMNEPSDEVSELKLAKLGFIIENIEDKYNEDIEKVIVSDDAEELNNVVKQNESANQNNSLVEEIKPCSRIEDNISESLLKVQDFNSHEQQSVAIHDLEILLEEINDTIDLSVKFPFIQKSEILQNTLDEVQTVIMKLKCDCDGSLDDVVEDLECSVRSVQLQIKEQSSQALLKEACANLETLVTYLRKKYANNESPKAMNAIYRCNEDIDQAIQLLERVPCLNGNSQLDNIISNLSDIKNSMKKLKYSFSVDAEFLIVAGIEVLENLNHVEDKIFSLENELDASSDIDKISKDSLTTAIHSMYASICNMRGTLCGIKKIYMYENYGKPSAYLLKSIKNTNVLSTYDPKVEWHQFKNSIRKVLNHFEDIKFYINFDKTARMPSDSAFTKIILGELNITMSEVVLQNIRHLNINVTDQVKDVINCVNKNLEKIENKTILEVNEKIPIFKELSVKIFDLTENIKTSLKRDSSDTNKLLTETKELSINEKEKQVPIVKDGNIKTDSEGRKANSDLEYKKNIEKKGSEEKEKDILGSQEATNAEVLNIQKDCKETNTNRLSLDISKNLPDVEDFDEKVNDSDIQNYLDFENQKENKKETRIIKKDKDGQDCMNVENLKADNYICKTENENTTQDENNIRYENIVINCESKVLENEIKQQHNELNIISNNTVNNEIDSNTLIDSNDICIQQRVQTEKDVIRKPEENINKTIQEETSPLQSDISIKEAVATVPNVEEVELTKDVCISSTKIFMDIISSEVGMNIETNDIKFLNSVQKTNQTHFDHNEIVEKIVLLNEKNKKEENVQDIDELSILDGMEIKKGEVQENNSVLVTQRIIEPKNDYNVTEIDIDINEDSELNERKHRPSQFCEVQKDYDELNLLEVEIKGGKDPINVQRCDKLTKDEQSKKRHEAHDIIEATEHIKDDYVNKVIDNLIVQGDGHEFTNETKEREISELQQVLPQCDMTQSSNSIYEIKSEFDRKYDLCKDTDIDIVSTQINEKRYENKDQTNIKVEDVEKDEKVDLTEIIEKVCPSQSLFVSQDDENQNLGQGKERLLESNTAQEFINNETKFTEFSIVSKTLETSHNSRSTDVVQDTCQGKHNQNDSYTKVISLEDHDDRNTLSDEKVKNELVDGDDSEILTKINKSEKKNSVTQNELQLFSENETRIHEHGEMTEYLYVEEILDEDVISSSEIGLVKNESVAIQNIFQDKFDVVINERQVFEGKIVEKSKAECQKMASKTVKDIPLDENNQNLEEKNETGITAPQKNISANFNNTESNEKIGTTICLSVTDERNNLLHDNIPAQVMVEDTILQQNTEDQNNNLDTESAVAQKDVFDKKSEEKTEILICPVASGTESVEILEYDKAIVQAYVVDNLPIKEKHKQIEEMKKVINKDVNRRDVSEKKLVKKADELVSQVKDIGNIHILEYKINQLPMNQHDEGISLLSKKHKVNHKNENNLPEMQNQNTIEKDKDGKTEICQNINIQDQMFQSLSDKKSEIKDMAISPIKVNQNITKKIKSEDSKKKLISNKTSIEGIDIVECEETFVGKMVQKKNLSTNENKNTKTEIAVMDDEIQENNLKKDIAATVICQDKNIENLETFVYERVPCMTTTQPMTQTQSLNIPIINNENQLKTCQDKSIEISEDENISISLTAQEEIFDSVQEKQTKKSKILANEEIHQGDTDEMKFEEKTVKCISKYDEIPKSVCSEFEVLTIPAKFQDDSLQPITKTQNVQDKGIEIFTSQKVFQDENLQPLIKNMNSEMQKAANNELYQEITNDRESKGEREKLICMDIHDKNEFDKTMNNNESEKKQIEFTYAVSMIDNQEVIGRKESIDGIDIQNLEMATTLEYENISLQDSVQGTVQETQKEENKDVVKTKTEELQNIEQLADKQNTLTCQGDIKKSILGKKKQERSNSKDEIKNEMQYEKEVSQNIIQQGDENEIDKKKILVNYEPENKSQGSKTKTKKTTILKSKEKKDFNEQKGSKNICDEDSEMTMEKKAGVGYSEQFGKIDMEPVPDANLSLNLGDLKDNSTLFSSDRSNESTELNAPKNILQCSIENQIQVKCSKEIKETFVEKQDENQSLLEVKHCEEEVKEKIPVQPNQSIAVILESIDIKDSQVNNKPCLYKTNEEGILKFESCDSLLKNEKSQCEVQSINQIIPIKLHTLTESKSEEIANTDILNIQASNIIETTVEIKRYDKDRPLFVFRNDINSNQEFLRPSNYNNRSFGCEDFVPKITTSNKNNVIYKAESLLCESQIKSVEPYYEHPQSFTTEAGTEKRHRPTKASSESTMSTLSERRAGFHRDVKRKPMFSTRLTDRTAVESSRVKLTCSILSSTVPVISWYKNGILLDIKQKCQTKYVDGLITLEILNAVPSDSGEYSCTVENEYGSITTSAILKVYPSFQASPIPPTFTRSIRDIYHLHENELILECRIRGQPLPIITWLKDNKPISQDERYQAHYLADGVCRLTIASPNEDDSGNYICKAENSMWSDQITHDVHFIRKESRHIKNIISENRHELRRPHFTNVLSDHIVVSGGTIGLQVQISGAPTRVEWLREGRSIIETYRNAQTYIDRGLYTLALPDVTEKESGLYTCRAWSIHGTVDMNASITVVHPNQFDGKPATIISRPVKDLLITIGEDINVSFRVQGEPKPKVFFMKGIKDITNSQRVCKMSSDDYVKFTLKRSVISDAGTYCVLAKNVYGCDRAFVTVVIRQRASSDNLVSDWIYPVDDLAISVVERNYKSVPDRIPNEPSAVDGGNNWVSLAWSKPDYQSKAPILAYKVESWLLGTKGGARWTELGVTPRNSFDAFNLKQGEEYHFRVTPRNRYGWGESVQTSTPIGIGLAGDRPEFIEILPGQLKVLVGEPAILSCSFKGKPTPEIMWMKNGHELEEELERIKIQFIGNNTSLRINEIKIEDEGRYSCEAANVHGRSSTYCRMAVITDRQIWAADAKLKRERSFGANGDYPPQFTMRLRDRRVQATYPVRLTCQVIGNPPPTVTWFKNAEEVSADNRHTTSQDEYFYTLEIAPTTLDDGGVYEAMARNGSGAISCRCNLVVDKGIRAYIAPEFCCGFEPLYCVCEGDELRISAVVEAYPTVGVIWYRDGVRLRPSRRAIMTLDHDGQIELAIASMTARDAGVYTCTASNEVGSASTSGKVEIVKGEHGAETSKVPPIVISPDILYSKEPMFIRKPRSSEAREGDTVIIECEVIGDPKPDVYWLRDFLKPDYYRDASHFKRVGAGPEYRFEIPHAKLDYTGAYSIVAKNMHGETKAIISLQILAKDPSSSVETHNIRYGRVEIIPRFDKELTDLLCYDGDAIEFECTVSGNPEPDIRWFHYNEIIPECSEFETSYNVGTARLRIKQVTVEDEGTYICEASNNMGKASSSACLVIYPPGEPNTLSQRLRRPPALLSASSTPRSTPRTTPARSLSRTPGPELSRLSSPSHEVAPKFYTYPYNRVVEEGDTVVFQCAVRGLPAPWTTWDKDGIIITPSARINIKEKDEMFRILEIEEVTIEDVGLYRIILENDYGRAEATARLEVISQIGKFYGCRSYSLSPRKSLPYRKRTPSLTRQE